MSQNHFFVFSVTASEEVSLWERLLLLNRNDGKAHQFKFLIPNFLLPLIQPIEMSIALRQAQRPSPKIADVENAGVNYAP